MPRRNRNAKRRHWLPKAQIVEVIEPEVSTDELARRLVRAGKASQLILGPLPPGRSYLPPTTTPQEIA